ncbi:Uncharacterised protein [uncultured archaeon]|nr:Uncharacterised protein [uncultured archaeon]
MALKAAIVMSVISIAMLAIYGADVMVAGHDTGNDNGNEKTGFLQMNASVRGSIFGIIPSAMLIISFFITRKEPSKKLGILITIGGALIIIGTAIILGMEGGNLPERAVREFGAVLAIGIIIAILGGLKIRKSTKIAATG